MAEGRIPVDMRRVEVIAPNFKKRLSGVTSTIVQLVPEQAKTVGIATLGPGLPASLPQMRWTQLPALWRRPLSGRRRIWHARRNIEMAAGIVLRALGAPLQLLFTSAAQRNHKPFTKWLIGRMDAVIATSHKSGQYLETPHEVIMHGIDLSRFSPPDNRAAEFAAANLPGKYAIGCFGRLRHNKGTDVFVEAMIRLLPDYPDWTAVITGRTTVEHAAFVDGLKAKVEAAGLGERVRFLGEVPDVTQWYKRITLYVAPSREEGFGLTPLEAMATQVAVVASDAGSYPELIEQGTTGAVAPAGDVDRFEAEIRPYLADPDLAARHGGAGNRRVRAEFPLSREASQIFDVYQRLWAKQ